MRWVLFAAVSHRPSSLKKRHIGNALPPDFGLDVFVFTKKEGYREVSSSSLCARH